MKYSLLEQEYKVKIKDKEINVKSPTIRNFLIIESKINSWDLLEILKAIDLLIPESWFTKAFKVINAEEIIEKVFGAIFQSNNSWKSKEEWFFPSTIDFLCPDSSRQIEYMKNTTINQMITQSAAKEWNMNLQNGKPENNRKILNRQISKEVIEAAKDRIRLKLNMKKDG